jgi:hypothetical protein
MSQSRKRKLIVVVPRPSASSLPAIARRAFADVIPVKSPLAMRNPSSVNPAVSGSSTGPACGATTCAIGKPCLCAKSKSRSSCAGTAITAPVP